VDLTAYAGAKMDARTLRDCTDAIMRDVTSLVADIRQLPAPVAGDGAKGTV
jgi:hypothetical protein